MSCERGDGFHDGERAEAMDIVVGSLRRGVRWAPAFVAWAISSSCAREPLGPSLLLEEPPVPLISDPVSLAAAGPAGAPGVDVVYVSLPPGSLQSGSDVEVVNTANDVDELIPIFGGGFDPVAIPALPGDTLRFRVFASGLGDDLDRGRVVNEWEAIVPARSLPDIVRTYPRPGKRDVPVALSVLVVFSEPLDGASTGGGVELLLDGEPQPATASLSPDGLRIVLAPAAPLEPNTQYVLRIVESIEDLDGDAFGREELVSFTTGVPGSQTVLAPGDLCSDHPSTAIPTFEDANIEGAIRTALGFTSLDILTCEIVADLTHLTYNPAPYQTITPPPTAVTSLVGIQNLTGLRQLVLTNHALTDIGPLASLTNLDTLSLTVGNLTPPTLSDIGPISALTGLSYLNLNNTNAIADLRPLQGLSRLSALHIRFNSIADLAPLSGLTSLTRLNLAGNAIEDVSPLAGLTNLTWMAINYNSIRDISPLSSLTNVGGTLWLLNNELTDLAAIGRMSGIQRLFAHGNNITSLDGLENLTGIEDFALIDNPNLTDIEPLLANPGIAGAAINLVNTSVTCADVQRLLDRGARVQHTCGIPPVVLTSRPLARGTVGAAYFEVLMASGGTEVYTWSGGVVAPPELGLTLSNAGVISGVPTMPGRFVVHVNVQSGAVRALRTFSIVVSPP
jgi:hypothetical protein